MTQDQFYYCLKRILELREKINVEQATLRNRDSVHADQATPGHVDFNSLKADAMDEEDSELNTAELRALLKELAAQEAKIRAFVPVKFYGTRIEATLPKLPPLYLVVDMQRIAIENSPTTYKLA